MQSLIGLILCGGSSSRMQTDKCMIAYHGIPQWKYIYNILHQCCDKVYISCNVRQIHLFEGYNTITDNDLYHDAGPMTALMSAFHFMPHAYLVCGCDYPFISKGAIELLIEGRNSQKPATAATGSDGNYEPVLAIYEQECFSLLQKNYINGSTSLNKFLASVDADKILLPADASSGADTRDEYIKAMKKIELSQLL